MGKLICRFLGKLISWNTGLSRWRSMVGDRGKNGIRDNWFFDLVLGRNYRTQSLPILHHNPLDLVVRS